MSRGLMPVYSSAYQVITLSAMGDAETPAGGSVCMRCQGSFVSPRVETALQHRSDLQYLEITHKASTRRCRHFCSVVQPLDGSLWIIELLKKLFSRRIIQGMCLQNSHASGLDLLARQTTIVVMDGLMQRSPIAEVLRGREDIYYRHNVELTH